MPGRKKDKGKRTKGSVPVLLPLFNLLSQKFHLTSVVDISVAEFRPSHIYLQRNMDSVAVLIIIANKRRVWWLRKERGGYGMCVL